MKKSLKLLFRAVLVAAVVVVFYTTYSSGLDREIKRLYASHRQTADHAVGLAVKDKGTVLIGESLSDHNMLVMGSSELSSNVPENIRELFPNRQYPGDCSTVGHAYVQNCLHAMLLAANAVPTEDRDLVIIESLQWFQGNEINIDGFFSNFSEYQFYKFLTNRLTSRENKLYLCQRYISLENAGGEDLYETARDSLGDRAYSCLARLFCLVGVSPRQQEPCYPQTYTLACLYASDSVGGKVLFTLASPYYWMRGKVLALKDRYKACQWLKSLPEESEAVPVDLIWDEIYSAAEEEGVAACTNNDLYVYDQYFSAYLADSYSDLEGYYDDMPLLVSPEWADYRFFLSVCNDLDLHPYIVLMSTNGLYYDYVGIDRAERAAFYDLAETTAESYGMSCLNLQDCEYQPYFYCDVMHLGWKGWPYVVQNVLEYFSK